MGIFKSLINGVKKGATAAYMYGTPLGQLSTAAGYATGQKGTDYLLPFAETVAGAGGTVLGIPGATAIGADGVRRVYNTATQKNISKVIDPATGQAVHTNPAAPGTGATSPGAASPATSALNWGDEPAMVSPPSGGGYSSVLTPYAPAPPSADEEAHKQNITSLARLMGGQGEGLYNVSNPAYKQALDYYSRILSGDKGAVSQAIAPEAEMNAELTAGQEKAIGNSSLRGGARDTALAEAGRAGAGAISRLIPEARKNAAAAGGALAMQGMGLGSQQEGQAGSLYSSLADRELNDRLQSQGLDLQSQQLKLQEALGMKGLDMQQMGLALQEKLGMRGLDLQRAANMDSNALQRELGLAQINLSQQQVDLLKQQIQQAIKEGKGKAAGDLANILIKALPTVINIGSNILKPGTSTSPGSSYDSGD